jgi:hypothetical protein
LCNLTKGSVTNFELRSSIVKAWCQVEMKLLVRVQILKSNKVKEDKKPECMFFRYHQQAYMDRLNNQDMDQLKCLVHLDIQLQITTSVLAERGYMDKVK